MEVKGFNNKELNKAFITTPKIVCDYISALQRVLDMSEETNKKAIAKIRSIKLLQLSSEEIAETIDNVYDCDHNGARFIPNWETVAKAIVNAQERKSQGKEEE